ncbi:MAG: glycosyltransferase family 2 protein [Acidobacteriota bacterium]|nr:glycosyltransferase family 2 protein [Acidobacteriota bacterium]
MRQLSLSIVIPTYGRVESLGRLLASIAAQSVAPFEVIVVDQNGAGVLDDVLTATDFEITHLRLAEPNAAAARNAGFNAATSTHVLFVDDDEVLSHDFIERMIGVFARHPEVRCLWPVVYSGDRAAAARYWRRQAIGRAIPGTSLMRIRRAGGGGVAFEREFFRATGGYDETLFRFGGMSEDWELGLRMRRRRLAIWHDASLFLRHEPAMSGGCGVRSLPYDVARIRVARAYVLLQRIGHGAPFRLGLRDAWPIVRVALLSTLGRLEGRSILLRRPLWHLQTIVRAMRESHAFATMHAARYADPAHVDHLTKPVVRVLAHNAVRMEVASGLEVASGA